LRDAVKVDSGHQGLLRRNRAELENSPVSGQNQEIVRRIEIPLPIRF
jgi:hypothetical protein